MGALSGNNVQVIFPAVVLMIAVGFVAPAGFEVAAPLGLVAPVFAAGGLCLAASDCATAVNAINMISNKIAKLLRISAPCI
jgi:hypothetical protein